MNSYSERGRRAFTPACALLAVSAGTFEEFSPLAILWTAPAILLAAMLIAWAAESAQYFIAQGFALAILAWLQTLPEFAVEAVLAWKQQVSLLLANLTGALRLLTGLGWPMIYFTAALFYRKKHRRALSSIALENEHCVEIVGLVAALAYAGVICWKGSLNLWDAAALAGIYVIYLVMLQRMPPLDAEKVEDMESIPRAIITAPRTVRIAAITGLFLIGGGMIYFAAEPFLASLLAVSTALGVPQFVFVQWVAPFVSEFPEKVSAFYWARTVKGSPTALMNMVSSNINQWTLLAAMLPIVYSMSIGVPSAIQFDREQQTELLLTLAQALLATIFLLDMKLHWWEATGLFVLWLGQFALSPVARVHEYFIAAHLLWCAVEIGRIAAGKRRLAALTLFRAMWKDQIRREH